MIFQVVFDFIDIEQVIFIVEKVVCGGVYWFEVGIFFIKKEGMRVVEFMKRCFLDRKIVVDFKIMDIGVFEVEMVVRYGVDVVFILGVVDDKIIKDVVEVVRRYGIRVMVDLIGVKDKVKRVKEFEKMGVYYIFVYIGIDEQVQGKNLFEDFEKVVKVVKVLVVVVGGLNFDMIFKVIEFGVMIIIVGSVIIKVKDFEEVIRRIIDFFWGEYMMMIRKVMFDIMDYIRSVVENFKFEQVRGFVDVMIGVNKIFIYGVGRSGFVGKVFVMRFMYFDFNVYVVGEIIMLVFEVGDLFIVISGLGEIKSIVDVVQIVKEQGGKVVGIILYVDLIFGKFVDVVVEILGRIKVDVFIDYIVRQMFIQYKWIVFMGIFFEDFIMVFFDGIIVFFMVIFQKIEKDMKRKYVIFE